MYSPLNKFKKLVKILFSIPEYIYTRFLYKQPKLKSSFVCLRYLIADQDDFEHVSRAYGGIFPEKTESKISEAEKVCEHIFDLLGSGATKLSPGGDGYQPIDWHADFVSGFRWNPRKPSVHIQYGVTKGADIKLPWELSRFQHLNILGQAYLLTKNRKYAEEFRDQLLDWIGANPMGFGVNWTCAMEVAIRAANWLVSQEYFSASGHINDDFWRAFYRSILEHGTFIIRHLENRTSTRNNHYISDLVGLLFIGIYCPFFEESKEWRNFAINELLKEINTQIYPDGCDCEASTCYHRLVLELLFFAGLLAERSGSPLPCRFKDIVSKMFAVCLSTIKPDGTIPQIGDNDSGRFLIFCKRPILEFKYLLTIACIYYRDSQFKIEHFGFDEEVFWIFGTAGERTYKSLPYRTETCGSKAFPYAGWYIIRNHNDYCFVSCGPKDKRGNGGHAHNDKLSIELMVNGRNIIVDPGTYVYTSFPKMRNLFRSTKYHNTIEFFSSEQDELSERDIFRSPDAVKIQEATLKMDSTTILFLGEIHFKGIIHLRTIKYDIRSREWHISDKYSSKRQLKGKMLFHLLPGLTIDKKEVLDIETRERYASIEIRGQNIEIGKYDYSPEYGKKVEAVCLAISIPESNKGHDVQTYIKRI